MDQQLPQYTSSEVLPWEVALASWDDEQWEWIGDPFWSFSGDLEGLDIPPFAEDPSLSQNHTSMLPATCQQTLGSAERAGNQYTNIQQYRSLEAHFPTTITQSYYQQINYSSFGSPTYSQTPSLEMSPIQSQGSPYSVEPIATPSTMDPPYIPSHEGYNLFNGTQFQDDLAPTSFAQQPLNSTADGLLSDTVPENAQTHSEMSHEQAQNCPALNNQSGYSRKLSARRQRRNEKPVKCPICGMGHAYQAELDRHIIAQHKDQAEQHALSVERFLCPHCPHDFARKDHLTRHCQRKHGLKKKDKGK